MDARCAARSRYHIQITLFTATRRETLLIIINYAITDKKARFVQQRSVDFPAGDFYEKASHYPNWA